MSTESEFHASPVDHHQIASPGSQYQERRSKRTCSKPRAQPFTSRAPKIPLCRPIDCWQVLSGGSSLESTYLHVFPDRHCDDRVKVHYRRSMWPTRSQHHHWESHRSSRQPVPMTNISSGLRMSESLPAGAGNTRRIRYSPQQSHTALPGKSIRPHPAQMTRSGCLVYT